MAQELYKVSVPGSMMLFGEHAVLHGKQAIVCAVRHRLHMELIPNATQYITINDTRLGTITQDLAMLQVQEPFQFVLKTILLFKPQIKTGFCLTINSEFSSKIGLGSSAAVTVATIALLTKWLDVILLTEEQIFTLAKIVMLELQGSGSGADLAASIYGGVLGYIANTIEPISIKLPIIPNLTAIYCGYKTPTAEVIKKVQTAQLQQPQKYSHIFDAMHALATQAIATIQHANWRLLGVLFLEHHALQKALGTSNELLDKLVDELTSHQEIYGAKISGAGLGDCVIGLGELNKPILQDQEGLFQFSVRIDPEGLLYASN